MEILVKGKKATKPIFGCFACGCVFTANADESYYDSNDETNYCFCPECGAKCTGAELSCYFCKYAENCGLRRSAYDEQACDSFEVDKSNLWIRLGYYVEEE